MPKPLDATDVLRQANASYDSSPFSDWRNANTLRHNLVYRDTAVDIPGIPQLMENRGSHLEVHGSRFIDRLVSAVRTIQVAALKNTDTAKRKAQDAENFLDAIFADWEGGTEYHVDNPRTLGVGGLVYYGLYAVRFDFCKKIRNDLTSITDPDQLAEEVDKLLKGIYLNPFELACPHWSAISFEPDFSVVYERGEVKLSDLEKVMETDEDIRQYVTSSVMERDSSVYEKTVPYVHMEDGDFIYDIVGTAEDNRALQIRPNVIGRPSYVFAAGKLSPETAPLERYRPLLAPIYPVAEDLAYLGTLLNSAALQEGRTGYQIVAIGGKAAASAYEWTQMPAAERPTLAFDLTAEAIARPPEGFEIKNLPVPDRQILVQAYQQADSYLKEYGFPAPLSPDQALTGQASSGHLATREIEQANFSINPALTRLAAADKELCKLAGDYITKLDLKVSIPVFRSDSRVRELVHVDKTNFADIDVAVELNGSTASMDFAQKADDREAMQLGVKSKHSYMTKWERDPIQELDTIDQERLAEPLKEIVSQGVLEFIQAGMPQRIATAAAAQGIGLPTLPAGPGVVPQQGGPEVPGGPRNARPEGGSFPARGAAPNPEVQSEAQELMA